MRTSDIARYRTPFDHTAFSAAVRGGHAAALLRQLNERIGIIAMDHSGANVLRGFLPTTPSGDLDLLAMDAQPELVTVSNAGIPAFLSNYLDPKLIEILVSPMKFAIIAGEQKKGDWTTTVATFPVVESTGEVSTYGDFNANGSVEVNTNFPQRQTYHYQTFTQWGEKELAVAALAKIDWASRLNIASVLLLNKFQNQTYAFGVAGLQNYGLLNDPSLSAPISPTGPWVTETSDVIYADIVHLFQQLQTQANGTIDVDAKMVLALSPVNAVNLNKTNQFNVNVYDQIKKNFPSLRVETAPEYLTVSGELVQMIAEEVDGQETLTAAFTEKLRAHAMVVDTSSFKQKKSQGTYGTIIFRPIFVAQMLG
jgi:hypothetical protein